ncbi:MAG TPA: hypothetical protein VGJ16_13290 [Pirellulales bacterium]|jgi:hypothetical protein
MVPLHDEPSRPIDRAAYRCRVFGTRSTGWLQVGEQQFEVAVLDESARGFAVGLVYEQPIEWQPGQTLFLTRDDETLELRLANVSSETIAPTEADEQPVIRTRLGMMRLVEVTGRRVPKREGLYALEVLRRFFVMLLGLITPMRGMCAALGGSFTIAAVLVWTLEHTRPQQQRPEDDKKSHATARHETQEPGPKTKQYKPTDHTPGPKLRWPQWLESIMTGKTVNELQATQRRALKEMGRLLRPGLLVQPEVVELLELNEEQTEELLRIHQQALAIGEEAADATRAAEDHPGAAWRQQAILVLTPAQRKKLAAFLSEHVDDLDQLGSAKTSANSDAQPGGEK